MWKRIIILFALVVVFSYAQIPVNQQTKGPIKDSVWDPENPYIKGNKFVQALDGFKQTQFARLELDFGHPVTKENLIYLNQKTRWIEEETGWVVVSLSNYWKVGGETLEPYIPHQLNEININEWKERVAQNPAIYGQFISKDFLTLSIIIFFPVEENEIHAVRRLYDILEGINFNQQPLKKFWHEIKYIFWKTDLFPLKEKDGPEMYLSSWPTGRFAITQGFFRDIRLKAILGYILLFLPFLVIYFKFTPQYYFPVWTATFLPILFALGSIWLMHPLGIHQSVYSLPPIVATLIVSFSFNIQKMEVFWKEKDSLDRWQEAGKLIHPAIHLIALLTLVNFALFGWNLQGLWTAIEMDAVFLAGTGWAWIIAVYFLPALHFFFSRFTKEKNELKEWQKKLCWIIDKGLVLSLKGVLHVNFRILASRRLRLTCHLLPSLFLLVASILFLNGKFNTASEPLKYMPQDSNAVKMAQYANRDGGPGLDAIQILFGMPSVPDAIETDEFFKEITAFEKNIKSVPGIRNTFSIIEEAAYQFATVKDLQEPRVQNAVRLVMMGEDFTNPRVASRLHTDRFVLILAFHKMELSNELEKALLAARSLAKEFMARNPKLEIVVFGEVPFFAEMARIIPAQMPQIVLTSLIMIFFFYFIVGRKFGQNGYSVSPVKTGWILTQTFIFAVGVIGVGMVIFQIPLDMATAAVLPVSIAAAADFNVYPSLRFFQLLSIKKRKEAMEEALKEKGEAVVVDWLGSSLCLSLLTISLFTPIRDMGALSIVSLVACIGWSLTTTVPLLAAGIKK